MYNMNTENLSLHGLHSRYLHALVNMPLLYGPLYIYCCYLILHSIHQHFNSANTATSSNKQHPKSKKQSKSTPVQKNDDEMYRRIVIGSVVSSVLLLSMAPHQEARFLLPLLMPLVLIAVDAVSKLSQSFQVTSLMSC